MAAFSLCSPFLSAHHAAYLPTRTFPTCLPAWSRPPGVRSCSTDSSSASSFAVQEAPSPPPPTPGPASNPRHAPLTGLHRPREENVPGEFFVDHTCIDCDTCRWMAPSVFSRVGDMSAVHHQPSTPVERLRALQAMLSCPTASIHERPVPHSTPTLRAAQETFPLPISTELPGVFHCGYHSPISFGATSYLVTVLPGYNILVDSPRYTPALVARLEEVGGVQAMFLTHRDDIADHEKWAARFGCQRIMHSADVGASTHGVEVKLEGGGPWALPTLLGGVPVGAGLPSLTIIHTPGHTAGSCCLLLEYPEESEGALFTGDHLSAAWDSDHLSIHEEHNWQSVNLQKESVCKLRSLPFLWILPGHGRRHRFNSVKEKEAALQKYCQH